MGCFSGAKVQQKTHTIRNEVTKNMSTEHITRNNNV